MRIGIAANFGYGFSGGRIHAYLLGAEIAAQGHLVTFVTNQRPYFAEHLPKVPGSELLNFQKLRFDLLRSNEQLVFDLWIVVQERTLDGRFFQPVFENARRLGTTLALLSFETPNWQAACIRGFAPNQQDAILKATLDLGGHCISSTRLGRKWATEYFPQIPDHRFHVLSPPILASFFEGETIARDPRLIVAFIRQASAHKGHSDIVKLLNKRLAGWKVTLVGGDNETIESLSLIERAHSNGIDLEWLSGLDEPGKHRLLQSARVLLFPSRFEGFGLPPAEAGYWGTPTVCYELEVLREIYGDELYYANSHTLESLEIALHEELRYDRSFAPLKSARRIADFDRWREEVSDLLRKIEDDPIRPRPYRDGRSSTKYGIVIIDQLGNWNKNDAAAAAGANLEDCSLVSFETDLWKQANIDRISRGIPHKEFLPLPGTEIDNLRKKLIEALGACEEDLVFISEDLIVCPAETVRVATQLLSQSQHSGIAIPLRHHFADEHALHFFTESGDQLAACGVFKKRDILEALRLTELPGCRFHPLIDLSYLLLWGGRSIGAIEENAERLPPRSAAEFGFNLPSGTGSWQSLFEDTVNRRHLPVAPLPSPSRSKAPSVAKTRAAICHALFAIRSDLPSHELIGQALELLANNIDVWRKLWTPEAPYRCYAQIAANFLQCSQAFFSSNDLSEFTLASLAVAANPTLPAPADTAELKLFHFIQFWRDRFGNLAPS